jgi:hypothetical protein
MNTIKTYLKNWSYMRILRLVFGALIIVQGFIAADWMLAGMGLLLSLLSFTNRGCCGVSGCATVNSKSGKAEDEISFEEVK